MEAIPFAIGFGMLMFLLVYGKIMYKELKCKK